MALTTPELDKIGDPARGTRLDCWKEIAAYLGRSEKTVRRWEMDRGLPIHRAPGAGRTAVYAYTAELDQWLKSGRSEDPDAPLVAETSRIGTVGTMMVAAPNTQPIEAFNNLPAHRLASISGRNPILIAILGAAAIGAAIFTAAHRFPLLGSSHPISSVSGKAHPANPYPSVASGTVSDAEKSLANNLYLKGRYEWNQRTPDSLNRALDDFTQAVVHDPNEARSYVGLADTYNLLHIYSTLPLTDSYPRAIAAARRAVQLDDSLAEAHRALAFAEFYGAGNWVESEKEFRRAIQLDPNDPVTRRWYGNAFAMPGRFEQSMQQFDKAQELDPASHSTLSDKGILLFDYGRREEGISLLKQVERTDPAFFSPHDYLMIISFELHDDRSFLDEGQKAARIRNDSVLKDILTSAREGYARSGETGLLRNLYAKQEEYYVKGKLSGGMLAITCVTLGKRQEALQLLEVSYARHEADALWCLTDPVLRTLKDEPRYKELVKKINFPSASDEPPKPSLEADRSSPKVSP